MGHKCRQCICPIIMLLNSLIVVHRLICVKFTLWDTNRNSVLYRNVCHAMPCLFMAEDEGILCMFAGIIVYMIEI